MKRKIATIVIMAVLTGNTFNCINAEEIIANDAQTQVELVEDVKDINYVSDDTEAILLEKEALDKVDKEDLFELLDDGVRVIADSDCDEELNEIFDDEILEEYDGEKVKGYEISASGEEYNITPITVSGAVKIDSKAYLEGDRIKETEDFLESELKKIGNEEISLNDAEMLISDEKDDIDIEKISKEHLATLQASNSIGKSFAQNSHKSLIYGNKDGKASAVSNKKDAKSGSKKVGVMTITIYAIKAGTNKKTTYDAIYTTTLISGASKYGVYSFTVQNRLYEDGNSEIIDVSKLIGGNESETVSVGISLDGKNKGFTGGYSYTYDPNGMKISTSLADEYQPRWNCTVNKLVPDELYKITPMIIIQNKKGKKKEMEISARFRDVVLMKQQWVLYYLKNYTGGQYVHFKIKNHKEV